LVNKERIIKDFVDLAEIESLSLNERNMANKIKEKFSKVSNDIFEDDASIKIGGNCGNIIIDLKGKKDVPPILFSAHMDTVGPAKNKKVVVENGYIKSDGKTVLGGDDLAGVVSILEAFRYIKENDVEHGNIQAVITVAEEIGLLGAKNLDFEKINAKYGFVLDNVGEIGGAVIKAPAHNVIETIVKGKAVHAGLEPEKGVSAILISANAISRLNTGRIDNETTSNIGIIEGGSATNVVCDKVILKSEIRSLDREKLNKETENYIKIFSEEAEKLGGAVDHKVEFEYANFNIKRDSSIINILKDAAKLTEVNLDLQSSGGGSDTNVFNEKGIESVDLSIGEDKIHSVNEQIKIDDIVKASEFVINIIKAVK
jgi:tripeptide aminopeptidase